MKDKIIYESVKAKCPACGNEDDLQCFDVLGADNGYVFCNVCGKEVQVELVD